MEKLEYNDKKCSSVVLFLLLHTMFTVPLLIGMAYIQIQITLHITQQERENSNLREMLNNHIHMEFSSKRENVPMDTKQGKAFQYETMKPKEGEEDKENTELGEHGVDLNPLISRIKRAAKSKCCEKGSRGRKGQKGLKGRRGKKGEKGGKGDAGEDGHKGRGGRYGAKGEKGDIGSVGADGRSGRDGQHGAKGDKGAKGESGKTMFAESAHVVGRGQTKIPDVIKTNIDRKNVYLMTSWVSRHQVGQISYSNGFLKVGVEGYYYIYAQINYKDGQDTINGFMICIDDKPVIQASNSVISPTRKYNTNYIGGVFHIYAGEGISVRTHYDQQYNFVETKSYFGAFMIHS